jgi:hypothetical protein
MIFNRTFEKSMLLANSSAEFVSPVLFLPIMRIRIETTIEMVTRPIAPRQFYYPFVQV